MVVLEQKGYIPRPKHLPKHRTVVSFPDPGPPTILFRVREGLGPRLGSHVRSEVMRHNVHAHEKILVDREKKGAGGCILSVRLESLSSSQTLTSSTSGSSMWMWKRRWEDVYSDSFLSLSLFLSLLQVSWPMSQPHNYAKCCHLGLVAYQARL